MANTVIAGEYLNWLIMLGFKGVTLNYKTKKILLNKETVESYEVVADEHRKSASSGIVRGAIGGALLGPVGLIAGGLSAKNKGIYQISIQFKDGKKSLIKVEKSIYDRLIKDLY